MDFVAVLSVAFGGLRLPKTSHKRGSLAISSVLAADWTGSTGAYMDVSQDQSVADTNVQRRLVGIHANPDVLSRQRFQQVLEFSFLVGCQWTMTSSDLFIFFLDTMHHMLFPAATQHSSKLSHLCSDASM